MATKEPVWITQRPANTAYYSAVVRFSKKAPNYVDSARDNALREISTQISVQIDSDIYLKETEANGVPTEELISQIRSSSRNKLNDIELAGSYETDKDYWAYYRLSKSAYRAWRIGQRDIAVSSAKNLLAEYDSVTNDAVSGITSLLKAMELIVDFTDLDLAVMYQGKEVNLYNELFNRLHRLPERLQPYMEETNLAVVAKLQRVYTVPAGITFESETGKYPCRAFPLVFSFSRGKGDLVSNAQTGGDGKTEMILKRVEQFTTPQQIILSPDKNYWLQSLENPVVKRLFSSLKFPVATLYLQVSRPKAYIDYSFNDKPGTAYKEMLTNKLQDLDMDVVPDASASDFTFKVMINSHEGDYVPRLKLYSATADAYVELIATKQAKSIYNTNVTGIKCTGSTRENALRNCELNGVAEISDMLLFMLVEQYIMN
ncbi:MAG: hypothetical protein CVU50_01320 [Candidatus Cloacimonetes bacterium HGW-Cloacimonetes-3]|jgi:hypothetical protein|nr:MAG: hypothetical protein CVU50_01320 [Candidatus Cloacimonetes bacterium HGW-Cloacimonetes-3]